jgi:flagellar basal-body rod protein FlgB
MAIETSKYTHIAHEALSFRNLKQKFIAGNIANVDTPFYKAKDIEFESTLASSISKLNTIDKKLDLAQTNSKHLIPKEDQLKTRGTIYLRPNHASRNDGNSVDLDIETTQMNKNAIMVEAITAALKKQSMIFKSVIDASSKT